MSSSAASKAAGQEDVEPTAAHPVNSSLTAINQTNDELSTRLSATADCAPASSRAVLSSSSRSGGSFEITACRGCKAEGLRSKSVCESASCVDPAVAVAEATTVSALGSAGIVASKSAESEGIRSYKHASRNALVTSPPETQFLSDDPFMQNLFALAAGQFQPTFKSENSGTASGGVASNNDKLPTERNNATHHNIQIAHSIVSSLPVGSKSAARSKHRETVRNTAQKFLVPLLLL